KAKPVKPAPKPKRAVRRCMKPKAAVAGGAPIRHAWSQGGRQATGVHLQLPTASRKQLEPCVSPIAQTVALMESGSQSIGEQSRICSGHTACHEQGDPTLSHAQAAPGAPSVKHMGGAMGGGPQSSQVQLTTGHQATQVHVPPVSRSQANPPGLPFKHMIASAGASPHSAAEHEGTSSSPIEIGPLLHPTSAPSTKRQPMPLTRRSSTRDTCDARARPTESGRASERSARRADAPPPI